MYKRQGYVVVPFQKGIASVGGYLYDRAEEMGQLKKVLAENQALKDQVDALTMENAQLQQDKYELTSLRELYEIDKATSEYEKTGARVIATDSSNWFYSFVIDKGSDDGIQVDMNVLAGSGLAGRVVSVGPVSYTHLDVYKRQTRRIPPAGKSWNRLPMKKVRNIFIKCWLPWIRNRQSRSMPTM